MAKKPTHSAPSAVPRPVGAPTTYRPEFCQMLLNHARQGNSFESFSASIGTHRSTLYDWMKSHPEFADARKQAFELTTQFYENLGKMMATGQLRRVTMEEPIIENGRPVLGPDGQPMMRKHYEPTSGNPAVFIFMTKNIIGWRDKRDIHFGLVDPNQSTLTPVEQMTQEQLESRAAQVAREVQSMLEESKK